MTKVLKFVLSVITLLAVGCTPVPSNVFALSTDDCGVHWDLIKAGTAAPKHTGNYCGYNIAIPAWPMPGDAEFKVQFKNQVLVKVLFSYTYEIVDPLKFIDGARYLGKMKDGEGLELSAESVGSRYEMAENTIIDKTLRDITSEITRNIDLVDSNPSDIEDKVFELINKEMEKRGIKLSNMSFVPVPDEQTKLAIDTAVAVRIYDAAGIKDEGLKIAIAKAGAPKITIQKPETESSDSK